jgi:homoserine dehydrogenase
MTDEVVRIALVGFGNVGKGLVHILAKHPELPLMITGVADRGGAAIASKGLDPTSLLAAKQRGSVAEHAAGQRGLAGAAFLDAAHANVLVEAASTNFIDAEPGWSYVQAAMARRMDVVLASKGPLVLYWDELWAKADECGVQVRFAGTTGAPLPAIEVARSALLGSRLKRLHALLNATTGFIIETMEGGASLAEGIRSAQQAGVAETDPTLDIEGFDAAAKCVILANTLFGSSLKLEQVHRQGITALTTEEVQTAARAGTPIRLLADIQRDGETVRASVAPTPLPLGNPLATLRHGALGIVYDAEPVGPIFTAVYKVGGIPTAAAVLRDILSLRISHP